MFELHIAVYILLYLVLYILAETLTEVFETKRIWTFFWGVMFIIIFDFLFHINMNFL